MYEQDPTIDDLTFPHPLAEEVYASILKADLSQFDYEALMVTPEELAQFKKDAALVEGMSVEEYIARYTTVVAMDGATISESDRRMVRSIQLSSARLSIDRHEAIVVQETQIRRMVNWVLHGLVAEPSLAVHYAFGYGPVGPERALLPSVGMVGEVMDVQDNGGHKRAPVTAAWRLGRLLTPEVVEAVTSVEDRLVPISVWGVPASARTSYLMSPDVFTELRASKPQPELLSDMVVAMPVIPPSVILTEGEA